MTKISSISTDNATSANFTIPLRQRLENLKDPASQDLRRCDALKEFLPEAINFLKKDGNHIHSECIAHFLMGKVDYLPPGLNLRRSEIPNEIKSVLFNLIRTHRYGVFGKIENSLKTIDKLSELNRYLHNAAAASMIEFAPENSNHHLEAKQEIKITPNKTDAAVLQKQLEEQLREKERQAENQLRAAIEVASYEKLKTSTDLVRTLKWMVDKEATAPSDVGQAINAAKARYMSGHNSGDFDRLSLFHKAVKAALVDKFCRMNAKSDIADTMRTAFTQHLEALENAHGNKEKHQECNLTFSEFLNELQQDQHFPAATHTTISSLKNPSWNPNESLIYSVKNGDTRVGKAEELADIDSFWQFDLKKTDGFFKFVIGKDDKIRIGYDSNEISHDALPLPIKSDVKGAGSISFSGGKILSISNYSGHYEPSPLNSIYSFGKIAKHLRLDESEYEVVVGLRHVAGSWDGYSYTMLAVVHRDLKSEDVKWSAGNAAFFNAQESKSSIAKRWSYREFSEKCPEELRSYLQQFTCWSLRKGGIYDNMKDKPELNLDHPMCKFLGLIGIDPQTIIPALPQGRNEM